MIARMRLVVCVLSLGLVAGALPARADSIEGAWTGKGVARLISGDVEPLRCQVRFEDGGSRTFVMNVTCTHSMGTVKQSGRVVHLGDGRFSGRLYSNSYGVSGKVKIVMADGRQRVTVTSLQGTASLVFERV